MKTIKHPKGFWTFEAVKAAALKCKTKAEFASLSGGTPYAKACREGWLKEINKHLKQRGNLYRRKIYILIFNEKFVYVGISCNPDQRIKAHKAGYNPNKNLEKVLKQKMECKAIIHDEFLTIDEVCKKERELIKKYRRDKKYQCLNISDGGEAGGLPDGKWTENTLKKEALKYKSSGEMKVKNLTAYNFAKKNKWLKRIGPHFITRGTKWTKETLREEILKYKTPAELKLKNRTVYYIVFKRKLKFEEIAPHFPLRKVWTKSALKKEALKYKNASEMRLGSKTAFAAVYKKKLILREIAPHFRSRSEASKAAWQTRINALYNKI